MQTCRGAIRFDPCTPPDDHRAIVTRHIPRLCARGLEATERHNSAVHQKAVSVFITFRLYRCHRALERDTGRRYRPEGCRQRGVRQRNLPAAARASSSASGSPACCKGTILAKGKLRSRITQFLILSYLVQISAQLVLKYRDIGATQRLTFDIAIIAISASGLMSCYLYPCSFVLCHLPLVLCF
jgi:hypothetical protein